MSEHLGILRAAAVAAITTRIKECREEADAQLRSALESESRANIVPLDDKDLWDSLGHLSREAARMATHEVILLEQAIETFLVAP
ncbi:hypothetical protein UFOVP1196_42 [uncultured Caudovirales phage]|uniref:Uncharacterized protein n=1 Tax=uncultured Caudovirales phage TaxID=2100421 RepID=A0A6J5R9T4_9CAUD|nr:hypothetical protein UFOVP1196_42 [uncultured Caudovirales phage]